MYIYWFSLAHCWADKLLSETRRQWTRYDSKPTPRTSEVLGSGWFESLTKLVATRVCKKLPVTLPCLGATFPFNCISCVLDCLDTHAHAHICTGSCTLLSPATSTRFLLLAVMIPLYSYMTKLESGGVPSRRGGAFTAGCRCFKVDAVTYRCRWRNILRLYGVYVRKSQIANCNYKNISWPKVMASCSAAVSSSKLIRSPRGGACSPRLKRATWTFDNYWPLGIEL